VREAKDKSDDVNIILCRASRCYT